MKLNLHLNFNLKLRAQDEKFEKKSLEEHNKFRRKHGVPPLTLNKEVNTVFLPSPLIRR